MGGLQEREALLALLQLSIALEKCEEAGVIWNDAKLNNILVDGRGMAWNPRQNQ